MKRTDSLRATLFGLVGGIVAGVIGTTWAGRDGSGTYSLPAGNPVQPGTQITTTWANNTLNDIATALTNSIAKNGETVATADLPMGGNKHTNVADATARNQYSSAAQVQDGDFQLVSSVSGTDTITGSLSPAISAYADGMRVVLFPAATNTGAVTLGLNGIMARDVVKGDGTALVAGDLVAGVPVFLFYDLSNTRWSLVNPQEIVDARLSSNVALLDGISPFTAAQTLSGAVNKFLTINGTTANGPYVDLQDGGVAFGQFGTGAQMGGGFTANAFAFKGVGQNIEFSANSATSPVFEVNASGVAIGGGQTLADSDNIALLDSQNTFTHSGVRPSAIRIESAVPGFEIKDTDAATNEGLWGLFVSLDSVLTLAAFHDTSGSEPALEITRGSGATISTTNFPNGELQYGGTEVATVNTNWAASDITSGTFADARVAQSNVTQHEAAIDVNNANWNGTDLALGNGGTGSSTAAGARTNLGIGSMATRDVTIQNGGSPSGGSDGDVFLIY